MRSTIRFVAALILTCAIAFSCRTRTSVARVEATLESLLPLGADTIRSLRVLDSLGVEHSAYVQKDRLIQASFGTSGRRYFGLVRDDVYVTLHYDSTHRLVRREVKELSTGP